MALDKGRECGVEICFLFKALSVLYLVPFVLSPQILLLNRLLLCKSLIEVAISVGSAHWYICVP